MNCYKVVILLTICVTLWPKDVQSVVTLVGSSIRKKGTVSKKSGQRNIIPDLVKDKKMKPKSNIVKDLINIFEPSTGQLPKKGNLGPGHIGGNSRGRRGLRLWKMMKKSLELTRN